MYKPENFYPLTESTSKVLEEIREKNEFVVGITKSWDPNKRALIVDLGNDFIGIIPECEITLEELKYRDNKKNEMPIQAKSRINQKTCAKITGIEGKKVFLSRKALHIDAIGKLEINKIYSVLITAVCPYGIYVDSGVGLPAFIHISEISTTRFKSMNDIDMKPGTTINCVLLTVGPKICMSYRRAISSPLFNRGDYIDGIVRAELDDQTGYFVEISPNECGIVDSITETGKKIEIPYGTHIRCRVRGIKVVSDKGSGAKTQYKLRLAN